MDIRSAEKLVLKTYPGYVVTRRFQGVLDGEVTFAFILTKDEVLSVTVTVQNGSVMEANGPMASLIIHSLKEA
jgi:hypothetical protein